ncbi:MAG: trans-2-enoyl-CoA reductase family protein [Chloroflexi bacterium]|nr:trans-2-enoyl-CoA reductase family protein [Chloroflexota bacterium]
MSKQIVEQRIRGFISLTAHPEGCAANVRAQIEVARGLEGGAGLGQVLVVGSSTGYGLASLLCSCFGAGASTIGVCLERPPEGDKTGSAGWYNLAEAHRIAAAESRSLETVNGDAFSHEVKQQVIERLRARGARLDLVVYSLASPLRKDPDGETTWRSTLKPIGEPYTDKSVDLRKREIIDAHIEPASAEEIASTERVMGGDDWRLWIEALRDAGVLAEGCRSVAYSYIGPELSRAIYRSGTIGRAKEHLEATAHGLHEELARSGGGAWVSVNKAVVTQASAAIPGVPLYIAMLFEVMRERGLHEGPIEQVARLVRDQLASGAAPQTDAAGRIRLDDWEMREDVQAEVARRWREVTTERIEELADFAGYEREFEQLFGFGVEGVDYGAPTELDRPLG